jgi:ferritin-like metal-binding protein YciE
MTRKMNGYDLHHPSKRFPEYTFDKTNKMTETHPIKTLHQLLDEEARRFTVSEVELKNALPGWIIKAQSMKLKNILQRYYEQVKEHIRDLDKFFEDENLGFVNVPHPIMKTFINDAEERLTNCTDFMVRDAGLLASVQIINHYKISAYGTAAAFANSLGMSKTAVLFHQCEVNEKQIDDRLSQLAEHEINKQAISAANLI